MAKMEIPGNSSKKRWKLAMRAAALSIVLSATVVSAQSQSPDAMRANFHGPASEAVEPFRVVGNIYHVGAKGIASYLITTPEGHILIDTGTNEMHLGIKRNVEKLGFKLQDIKIMLSSHTHYDHVQGHALMKRATGAQVMALGGDAVALASGHDNSALGDEGWEPVKVDRVLKDGDTVSLGGRTLRALWTPGHTQGATMWLTNVREKDKTYAVAFRGGEIPNGGVPLFNNPRHPNVIADTQRTLRVLKELNPPDIYLSNHPGNFGGKIERIKAGETPHPLADPEVWRKMVANAEANWQSMLKEAEAKEKPKNQRP
jgi:metallo-beta-lactamase class B